MNGSLILIAVLVPLVLLLSLFAGLWLLRPPRFIRDGTYRNRAQCEHALAYFSHRLARYPQDWETYLKRGEAFVFLKNYQQAVRDYTRALALHPNDEGILVRRARAHTKMRTYDEAIWDCTRALDINPLYSPAYSARGLAYFAAGEHGRALSDYTRAIEMDPENSQHYLKRGQYYLRIMELEKARADWLQGWKRKPEITAGLFLNWLQLAQSDGQEDAHIACELEKVARLAPRSSEAQLCLGIALYLRKAYEQALARLTRASASEPENEYITFWQGMVLATLQRNMQAEQAFLRTSDLGLPKALWQPIVRLGEQTQRTYWSY